MSKEFNCVNYGPTSDMQRVMRRMNDLSAQGWVRVATVAAFGNSVHHYFEREVPIAPSGPYRSLGYRSLGDNGNQNSE
jgi:hypothetical protein